MPSAMEETGDFQVFWKSAIQRAPLGLTQGFAISFYTSSTGQLALLQLLSSQERKKMVEELLHSPYKMENKLITLHKNSDCAVF